MKNSIRKLVKALRKLAAMRGSEPLDSFTTHTCDKCGDVHLPHG